MRIKRFLAGLLAWLRYAVREGAGFAGCGLIIYGCWLVYPPAGYICGGVMLLAMVFLLSPGAGDKG